MRLKTKFKRLLAKKIDVCKEYISAQYFYLTKFSIQAFKFTINTSVLTLKLIIIGLILASISLFTERAHTAYIEHKVGANVLFIQAMLDSPYQGMATGFEVIAKSGKTYILTNAHVCGLRNKDNLLQIQEKRYTGRFIPRRIIEVYQDNDLCLVEGFEGYPGLTLGDQPEISDNVTSIGYPMGEALHIARGRIKNFTQVAILAPDVPIEECKGDRFFIKNVNLLFFTQDMCFRKYQATMSDIIIYPGNSGSPVVDGFGNVVGVVFASDSTTNWGVVVPFKDVKKLLDAY